MHFLGPPIRVVHQTIASTFPFKRDSFAPWRSMLLITLPRVRNATLTSPRASQHPVADRKLSVLGGGLGERLLDCALAAGRAGDRQLRGPGGDAADECCGALAARDLDRCPPAQLSEQPRAVRLR